MVHTSDSLREEAQSHAPLVLATALFGTISRAHILTAERSAIEMFSRELAAQRFEPADKGQAGAVVSARPC